MSEEGHLWSLERELLRPATRQDANRLCCLLHAEFREIGASGRSYSREEIVAALQQEPSRSLAMEPVQSMKLGERATLLLYRTSQVQPDGSASRIALRSSTWVRDADGEWRLRFHQGTLVEAP